MGLGTVNIAGCSLTQELHERGFRHRVERVGPRIGAQRIGAAVYVGEAGAPIWPYHYHHGVEEWLYVISGAPVLRDAGGRRELGPGDLACFPSGHRGAHTLDGPGRFMLLSAGGWPRPSVSVYPDSDKLGVLPGDVEVRRLNVLMVPRTAGVGYWHAEGSGAGAPREDEIVREPVDAESVAVVNALTIGVARCCADAPPGFRVRAATVGAALGATLLGATILDLDPDEGASPYHYECGREKWLLVLSGTPVVRRPDGEQRLQPGDLVCFPDGPAGAHRVVNRGGDTARVLLVSTQELPTNICQPDSGRWLIRNQAGAAPLALREADAVDCWEGEG